MILVVAIYELQHAHVINTYLALILSFLTICDTKKIFRFIMFLQIYEAGFTAPVKLNCSTLKRVTAKAYF